MKIFLIAVIVIAAALLVIQLILSAQFASRISELGRRLVSSQATRARDQSLIPPSMRDFATRNGGRLDGPLAVRMTQDAQMRLEVSQPFFRLDASQLSGTREPAFVWQAKGRMSVIVPLQVVDSFVERAGLLEVRIAGSFVVASSTGPETARGEAMRFLAELPWNPDAILNASGLVWKQTDETSVDVSMETTGGVARVTLHLDAAGDVIAIDAPDRPRAGDTPARWVGRFSDYAQNGAYRWPRHGEIAWDLPAGEFIYWRGNILSVSAVER
ncbi:MAG: DUF6544 family protein [Devosia sp.]